MSTPNTITIDTGIERERRYFDVACERMERAQAQGRLFEDAKVGAGDTAKG